MVASLGAVFQRTEYFMFGRMRELTLGAGRACHLVEQIAGACSVCGDDSQARQSMTFLARPPIMLSHTAAYG